MEILPGSEQYHDRMMKQIFDFAMLVTRCYMCLREDDIMKKFLAAGLVMAFVAIGCSAQKLPKKTEAEALPTATAIMQQAKKDCEKVNGGEFNSTERTVTLHDFTGDGRPEEVVDASQFACSTAASLWGGTGGTPLWVIVDGKAHEFKALQWKVVDSGKKKILKLALNPSECGDSSGACYRTLTWDGNSFAATK
jgi:hypothetical protein